MTTAIELKGEETTKTVHEVEDTTKPIEESIKKVSHLDID